MLQEAFPLNELLGDLQQASQGKSFSMCIQKCHGLAALYPCCPFHELGSFLSPVYFHFYSGSCLQQQAFILNNLLLVEEFMEGEGEGNSHSWCTMS